MNFSYTGFVEFDRILKQMPTAFEDRVLSSANIQSAKPIIDSARTFIKDKTSNLSDSIGSQRAPKATKEISGLVLVGPRFTRTGKVSKAKGGGLKGAHGYNVEYGHAFPFNGRKGKYSSTRNNKKKYGMVPPHPFLEPAYNQTKERVLNSMQKNIVIELDKLMRKLSKKYTP